MSPMNNRLLVPRKTPGLLDLVPGAAAAYSLRNLSRSYAGPVVTVRRSSDDAEEDFTAAEVADGTLAAFCGAGDGFVKTWHDQSGNGRDASQGTAAAQPKIVDSGSLVTEGGKAALEFDGTDDYLLASTVNVSQPCHYFIVAKRDSLVGKQNYTDGQIARNQIALESSTDKMAFFAGGTLVVSSFDATTLHEQISVLFNGAAFVAYRDGAEVATGDAGTLGVNELILGADTAKTSLLQGTMQEVILYPSDQSANRERIEGNIAWSYS